MHSVGFAFDLQVKLILLGVKRFLLPAVVTLAILLSFMWPMSLSAHAVMVKSSPEKDSTISQSPKKIDIWFNEKVRGAHKSLAVTDSTGKRVDNKDVKQELLDQSHIFTSIPDLPPDTYTVRYRVMSADTHVISGKFSFTIQKPQVKE
ncbi:MAG: copper resistance CopC family protein [Nitrosomonas sp.]